MSSLRSRLRRTGDDGFALVTVMGGMLALSLVLMATAGYVAASLPATKRGQDSAAALQAAQAGIDDYLARLTTCDVYWQPTATCRTGSVNASLTPGRPGADASAGATGWASISYSAAVSRAQYHVDELSSPVSSPPSAAITLRSTGRILVSGKSVKRTLEVDLRKASLLNLVYYTDKEALAPDSLVRRFPPRRTVDRNNGYAYVDWSGVTATEASKCNRWWYATATSTQRSQNVTETLRYYDSSNNLRATGTAAYSCDITFASSDVIDGKLHTNDAMLLSNPLFKGTTTTSWPAGSTPAPSAAAWYRPSGAGAAPQTAGKVPVFGNLIKLPDTNDAIRDATEPAKGGQDGCRYQGPTRIVLRSNGTMNVTSPRTTVTNPGCTTNSPATPAMTSAQNVPLPKNGVVYVDRSTASCSGKPSGTFPLKINDLTPYDCAAGDVFLEGTLKGQLTIAGRNDIIVTEDVTYASGTTGADVLGLVADGDVEIYHPVSCANTPPSGYACLDFTNIDVGLQDVIVSGALLSVRNSFTAQNFERGAKLGNLTVIGGIYQSFRGPVGTSGSPGTGYAKDYRYDARLAALTPPSFLNPVAAPWLAASYAEVRVPGGLPA